MSTNITTWNIKTESIFIWSDHGWVESKEKLIRHLKNEYPKIITQVFGPKNENTKVDYPDIAKIVCQNVLKFQNSVWILICGTGQWICMAANKVEWIRAWVINDSYSAQMIKEHNNANVICFGAREGLFKSYKTLIDIYLHTIFAWWRHKPRVDKLSFEYMNKKDS